MQVIVTARHCELDSEVRERIDQQFQNLEKFEPRVTRAEVTVTEEKSGFEAEAVLSIDRAERVHGHAEAPQVRDAVDRLIDKLGVQLRRAHSRRRDHKAPPMDQVFGAVESDAEAT
jgi:ribosomal subunit interface protein